MNNKITPSSKTELNTILREHAVRYPGMQPTDAVKLIYQNEFGGGHLISDEAACLAYLRREYAAVSKEPEALLMESIGNGIVRIHLAAVPEGELEPLGQCFLRSAATHKGNPDSYLSKLDVLRELTQEGIFAFDAGDLDSYLNEYRQQGYPPVSHSPQYRQLYHPAYRVVLEREAEKLGIPG